jgi:hypothetical protein
MGYFGSTGVIAATEVVEISGGYRVVIGLLSGKEEAECNAILNTGKKPTTKVSAMGIGTATTQHQETELTIDYASYRDAKLLRGIKSWNLDDEKGDVVPVSLANIQAMPERDRNTVFVALDKFNAPIPDDRLGE